MNSARRRSANPSHDRSNAVIVEHTQVLGAIHRPHAHQNAKKGHKGRTRYVDLESPAPYGGRGSSRSGNITPIQLEDVERATVPIVSPKLVRIKKKNKRSKRKQLEQARAQHREYESRTGARLKIVTGAAATKNATPSAKKIRIDAAAQPKNGIRAPSPIILAATPSGDNVLMLKGHGLIKSDMLEEPEEPSRDILLLRGNVPKHESVAKPKSPLPKLGAPPRFAQNVSRPNARKRRSDRKNRGSDERVHRKRHTDTAKTKDTALRPRPVVKVQSERSSVRDKFASAKRMSERVNKRAGARPVEASPPPALNNRKSSLRNKLAAAKTMATDTAAAADALAGVEARAEAAAGAAPLEVPDKPILEYLFENLEDHEKVHASVARDSSIACFTCTWNMHGKLPPDDLFQLLDLENHRYHLYSIATQECERSIMMSAMNASKAKWAAAVGKALGANYAMIRSHTLQAINIILYVHKSLEPLIGGVQSGVVATGLKVLEANMGNKGGVGICFDFACTSYLFVAAHFAAGQKHVKNRNADYARISTELPLVPASADEKTKSLPNVNDRFDVVIWQGDFNYRINGDRSEIEALLADNEMAELHQRDQLLIEQKQDMVFKGLLEGPVTFRPTYKFDTGTDNYDTSKKKRVPAWTDRILYKPAEGVDLQSYKSLPSIQTSDHKPVLGIFKCPVQLRPEETNAATAIAAAGGGTDLGQTQSQVCCIQ